MPSADFLSCMSRDFTKLLNNQDECNVTVKVGSRGKPFRAHSIILRARSPYFQKMLNKRNADVTLNKWLVKLPNVSPEVFELILRYIYGGSIVFERVNTRIVLDFLAAAGLFRLEDLYDHIQTYLLDEKSDWLRDCIVTTSQIAEQNIGFKKLRNFCKRIKEREPDLYFNCTDFTSIDERSLIRLLQRDDLGMEETEIWDRVIKWGTANTPQQPRVRRASGPNLDGIEKTLHKCIPHIRFFHISAADFRIKISPYKSILPVTLYSDLFQFHADPKYKPVTKVLEARHGAIESEIIDKKQAALIASWIDRRDEAYDETNVNSPNINNNVSFVPYKVSESPYEFELILRGSQAGFTAKTFHEHCDDKGPTVVLMKVRDSTEILGAYNPLHWESSLVDLATTESFLFSMRDKDDNPRRAILSRVKSPKHAIVCAPDNGPTFGAPYALAMRDNFNDPEKTGCCGGTSASYNVALRSIEERYFWVDEYEVFKVVRRSEFDSSECVGK
ncbi:8669_t:CDS:2 [Ambispora gerdemannii]|uniref:8669_t:CDS:1 n=1 Tax=Ambispora gerdemannii TaxID=144530 RepID=A0A9N9FJB9_9GLOM|nr:8669_t:CDS:2 [Ambispora gerdemannii]